MTEDGNTITLHIHRCSLPAIRAVIIIDDPLPGDNGTQEVQGALDAAQLYALFRFVLPNYTEEALGNYYYETHI